MNKITFEEYEKAMMTVKQFIKQYEGPQIKLLEKEPVHSYTLLVECYALSMRTVNQLNANGIINIGELYDLYHNNPAKLNSFRNIGNVTILEISNFFDEHPIILDSPPPMNELMKERIVRKVMQAIDDEFSQS